MLSVALGSAGLAAGTTALTIAGGVATANIAGYEISVNVNGLGFIPDGHWVF